ncbi:MAG: RNA polymerase sigma-70 factor [Tannerellaceae bacterium]|nr:RNA polymerase sigma-70 factor [Tannerellaceae bacterium]
MHPERFQTNQVLLFEQIRRGNVDAFEYTFRKYGPRLEAFARKFVIDPAEAEDIVQESFLKLWERMELLENVFLTSYLFMLVRNASLNVLKHQAVADTNRIRTVDLREVERLYSVDFIEDPSTILMEKELTGSVDEIMEALPEKCREVFKLSRLSGYKNREIAEQLGISEKVVEKHIARALKRFREGLKKYALWVIILFLLS